jgi:DNA-binding LytR/AlgR family response regulator
VPDRGLNVLAVDDDAAALAQLARSLGASALVDRVERADGSQQALMTLLDTPFDALFLAVEMPGFGGLALARVLQRFVHPPAVVFVTATESAAVEAFELDAVDYLVKPVAPARLHAALERVAVGAESATTADAPAEPAGSDEGVVLLDNSHGGGTRLLARSSILFLEANGDYIRVHADEGRFLLRARLTEIELSWESFGFVRVHRGYIVNLRRATEMRSSGNGAAMIVMADGSDVPISRRQVGELRRRLAIQWHPGHASVVGTSRRAALHG